MATVNVTSWTELVSAIENFTDGDTIKLTADIDLTTTYPYGVEKITLDANKTYIIDGSYTVSGQTLRHEIKGLSNDLQTPDHIFYAPNPSTGFQLKWIDFYNITLAGGDFYRNLNSDGETVRFENCRFLGRRSGNSYLINANHIYLLSCFINMPWDAPQATTLSYTSIAPKAASASTQTDYIAEYCWFREHYGGWALKKFGYNTVDTITWQCGFFKMSGCYLDGDMKVLNDSHSSVGGYNACEVLHHANAENYVPSAMNVMDVEITADTTFSKATYGYWFGLYVDRVKNKNGDSITEWRNGYNVSTTYSVPKVATVEEAQNEVWLWKNGIDIAYTP